MLSNSLRIWVALMVRDIRTRRGQSRLNYLLTMAEPFGQLGFIYAVFLALGRKADFGHSLFLFLVSGVMPYFLFTHITNRAMGVLRLAQPMRPFRLVNAVDVGIAILFLEMLTVTLIVVIIFIGCWVAGIPEAVPVDPLASIEAFVLISFTAFGVGLTNACIASSVIGYRLLWTLVSRSLIFFSNVFYVVDFLSIDFRDVLWWNPLLHGIIWFRTGMYEHYPQLTLSHSYLIVFCTLSILTGLALERILHRSA